MASETQIGKLVIDLQIKTQALEKGLETAKTKLKEIEQQNEKTTNSNKNLEGSYLAMSAVAVAALVKIGGAVKNAVNEYKQYESANKGLQSIVNGQGLDFKNAQGFIEDYISDGLIPLSDATLAYKNLASRGYDEGQIQKTMLALKDAAAFGRQSTYEYGEAIATATEGLKNENSILVDNAGVTKNVAKMWQDYAKSVGKTTESLTQEEKIQAEVNGIIEESKHQVGDAAKYANTLAGKQAQVNAASVELNKTVGESLQPTMTAYSSIQLAIIKNITTFVKEHKEASSGIAIFTVTFLAAVTAITAGKKAYDMYKTSTFAATAAQYGFNAAVAANPIGLIATGIAVAVTGIGLLVNAINEQNEATERLYEITARYNQIKNNTFEYTDENKAKVEADKENIEEQIKVMEKLQKIREEMQGNVVPEIQGANTQNLQNRYAVIVNGASNATQALNRQKAAVSATRKASDDLKKEYTKISKELDALRKKSGNYGNTLGELKKKQQENTKATEKFNAIEKIKAAMDVDTIKTEQKKAAELKANANQMQEYLNIIKKGNKNTNDYQNAEKELAKAYSEAATANGINQKIAQDCINTDQARADQAWNTSQENITANAKIITSFIELARAAENDKAKQAELAKTIGISYKNIIPTLSSVLSVLQLIGGYSPTDVPNVTPTKTATKASGGSKSYSNKRLDNYKKEIEHKKAMDQLSLQQEIAMYQTALKKYAKTQDEKRELQEKIYSLQKEFQEKEYSNYVAFVEHKKALDKKSVEEEINDYTWAYYHLAETTEQKRELEEKLYELHKELAQKEKSLLEQKTTDYERYIQDQKNLRGAEYDAKEQESDLNKIIALHKSYLNQIMKDERLSLDERKELYQEELDTIRDYEQQKRDLRVEAVNSTVSQLTSAITKQIEEVAEADKKAIEENIKIVEQWKDARIKAINEEYDTRITAIQKELDLLDKSEEEKSRAEEDAEYERKRNRLQQLVDFEHDATTKANYQKELDKLIAEYQKTLDSRALQDKKDALNAQKDLLQEEKDNKVQAVEDEAEKQKEVYDKQLDDLEEYYEKQKEMAQETAEKMLLNVEQNQNQILKLLGSYGDAYELTGQSLGEKLAQGINNGIADKIQNMIQKVQDTIDANIERKIKEWSASNYNYETSANNKPQAKTVNVYQTNNIQQNPEMPSETYRKLNNVSQSLAAELAGM